MTAHELARKLLEGPDTLVAIQRHEPNGDTFCAIERVEVETAWRVPFIGDYLWDSPPKNTKLVHRALPLVVLR
jgi:hypothetical protein